MALQLSLSHQSWSTSANPISQSDPTRVSGTRSVRWVEFGVAKSNPNTSRAGRCRVAGKLKREKVGERMRVVVKASLETQTAAGVAGGGPETVAGLVGKVTEVNKDSFWPIVNASADKPVVVDMYTQWCGPCKVMAPKFEKLAEQYLDVVFLKLDCNQENKSLAKELGIRVVPTFKILKGGKIVEEITGAKFDNLVAAIETARSS